MCTRPCTAARARWTPPCGGAGCLVSDFWVVGLTVLCWAVLTLVTEGRPRDDETANGINNEIAVAGAEVPPPEVM
jgi:hypothetical protein